MMAEPPLLGVIQAIVTPVFKLREVVGAVGVLGTFETVEVMSCDQITVGLSTRLSLAVSTFVERACAKSRVKVEVNEFQLNPKYGHTIIGKPVPLSTKDIDLKPHFVTPSAGPHTLLTASNI
jgi:hypothetical protein